MQIPGQQTLHFGRYRGVDFHHIPESYCRNLVNSPLYFFLSLDEKKALQKAGYTRSHDNPSNRLPITIVKPGDSKTISSIKAAYNSYCEWIAHGQPDNAWSFCAENFSVTSNTLFIRAEKEGLELSTDQLNVAKSLCIQERLIAAKSGSPDLRTEAIWLSTVKMIEEIYFSEGVAGERDNSILTSIIDREIESE